MRYGTRFWVRFCGAAALFAALSGWSAPADIVSSAWQNHKLRFNYFGFTSLYTCDGLEEHVHQILLHLGARSDAKVSAVGCVGSASTPTRNALVILDFYTLAPASDGSDTVKARWTPLELGPNRPSFMGDGDCELVQQMKDLITQNFSLRDVDYRTGCYPHAITIGAFEVKGQALRAIPNPGAG